LLLIATDAGVWLTALVDVAPGPDVVPELDVARLDEPLLQPINVSATTSTEMHVAAP
jgi:hypothetical protein